MSYKEKYIKYKKKYIDFKKQSIIEGGKPIYYFNDDPKSHPDIWYVDLSDQLCITSIKSFFCKKCVNLRYINLSPLSNVTSIGNNFMWLCKSLKSIDLSGLTKLENIGYGFMGGCTSLTSTKCSQKLKNKLIKSNPDRSEKTIKYIIIG